MPRINKCVELLEQGRTVTVTSAPTLTYEAGLKASQTWCDLLLVEFEHHPFDTVGLRDFMRGVKDGGPTPAGRPMPTVVATLPSNCITPEEVFYNAWQSRHALSTGIHGLLHTHARSPEAVRAFVSTARYPFQTIGLDEGIPEGRRGGGGQGAPAQIWGLEPREYVRRADPWPLNPDGELMLGLKIEDRHCLPNADRTAAVPGLAFAEWGPGDMGMSFGDPDAHDPPYSPQMDEARGIVRDACRKASLAFYCSWADDSMTEKERLKYSVEEIGSRIVPAPTRELAEYVWSLTGRDGP